MIQHLLWLPAACFVVACGPAHTSSDTATATTVNAGQATASASAIPSSPPPVATRHPTASASDSLALDSCTRLDTRARPQNRVRQPGETDPPARAGSWTDTRIDATSRFTLEVPSATSTVRQLSESSFAIDEFPSCRYSCSLQVSLHRDSTAGGASAYVDRLRTAAFSGDAEDSAWAPGPTRYLTIDGLPAVLVETPCGDCNSASVFAARGDTVVELQYFVDDREGYQPGIACRLARVAQTFQWAAAPPNGR